MDEFMLELELLKQLEELEEPKHQKPEEKEPTASPYFSVQHERTGQLVNLFNDLDAVLQAVFADEDMMDEPEEDV